jgi:hypothetical protein
MRKEGLNGLPLGLRHQRILTVLYTISCYSRNIALLKKSLKSVSYHKDFHCAIHHQLKKNITQKCTPPHCYSKNTTQESTPWYVILETKLLF